MIKGTIHSLKEAFVQMLRNKGMTIASLFSITAMMLILAVFFFLSVNVGLITDSVKDQFGTIEIFLLDDATTEQTENIINSIKDMDGIESVKYISKEQAMKEFKDRWGNNAYLLDGLSKNPLPNSLRITLSDISQGDLVATACGTMKGVEDVRFYRDEINKVLNISSAVQKIILVIIIFLVIISVVVVSNTVKLTVMARQEEIVIMKYVGATNWFIRGPMFLEGIIIGIVAAAISVGLSALIYTRLCDGLGAQAFQMLGTMLVEPGFLVRNVAWIFGALGVGIGACGSIISMRRYLKA